LSGQRVAAGVDLDLPVVSAVADHVLVLLDIQDEPNGAREASKSSSVTRLGQHHPCSAEADGNRTRLSRATAHTGFEDLNS